MPTLCLGLHAHIQLLELDLYIVCVCVVAGFYLTGLEGGCGIYIVRNYQCFSSIIVSTNCTVVLNLCRQIIMILSHYVLHNLSVFGCNIK